MAYLIGSGSIVDLGDLLFFAANQPAQIGGYTCVRQDDSALLDWPGPGGEPASLLYRDGHRADDVILLNDFIYAQAWYKRLGPPDEHVVPPLGWPVVTPYSIRHPQAPGARPEVDTCLQTIMAKPAEWRWAVRTALLWWLHGAKGSFYELRAVMLRMGFEVVWSTCRGEVSAALADIHQHIRNHGGIALPPTPVLQHYLIVSRHVRNHAAHSGNLGGAGPAIATRISGNCAHAPTPRYKVWSDWEDWDASISGIANGTFQPGVDVAVFDAVEFLQFILYCVLLRLLGLPLTHVEFTAAPGPGNVPAGWGQMARYLQTLRLQ